MNKRSFQIFTYSLPFRYPISLPGATQDRRNGLLLRLEDSDGVAGWGEIAPLPGFSKEQPAETLRNAETTARLWCSKFPDPLLTMRAPSIRFGMEQAERHIDVVRRNLSIHQLVSEKARDSVRLCALLRGDSHENLAKAIRGRLAGFRTVKLKVGRRAPDVDAHFVREFFAEMGTDVRIRLDANRGWSLEDAVKFGRLVADLPVDFIEEPVSNPVALAAFTDKSGLRIGLDETLAELKPAQWLKIKGATAVILKPTLLGGFKTCCEIASAGSSIGAEPVVSAAYESGVGMLGLAALAAAIQRPDSAAGLDTYTSLADDVLRERLDFVNGNLYLDAHAFDVRMETLQELSRG